MLLQLVLQLLLLQLRLCLFELLSQLLALVVQQHPHGTCVAHVDSETMEDGRQPRTVPPLGVGASSQGGGHLGHLHFHHERGGDVDARVVL